MDIPGQYQSRGEPPVDSEHRDVLPQSSSLIILLILFALISLVTIVSIVKGGGTITDGRETGGLEAFSPEDFPEIEWKDPSIDQLVAADSEQAGDAFMVAPPPFSEGIFPCSECHGDMEPNTEKRVLEDMHDDIILNHGPKTRWCFDCHNPADRDRLRLADGTLIGFDESYRLCGQCHGTIFRDWRQGIHGRRTGYWNGPKKYLLCAACHNPHAPKFKPIKPLPPPVRPQYLAGQ